MDGFSLITFGRFCSYEHLILPPLQRTCKALRPSLVCDDPFGVGAAYFATLEAEGFSARLHIALCLCLPLRRIDFSNRYQGDSMPLQFPSKSLPLLVLAYPQGPLLSYARYRS